MAGHYYTVLECILEPDIIFEGQKKIRILHDKEADVLYIDFKKPSHADDSELTDDDILIRYENNDIIGITIMNASKRKRQNELKP